MQWSGVCFCILFPSPVSSQTCIFNDCQREGSVWLSLNYNCGMLFLTSQIDFRKSSRTCRETWREDFTDHYLTPMLTEILLTQTFSLFDHWVTSITKVDWFLEFIIRNIRSLRENKMPAYSRSINLSSLPTTTHY